LLKKCNKCKAYKKSLEENNIVFSSVYCEDEPTECDNIENITNCNSYPMTILDFNNKVTIFYTGNDYQDLGKIKQHSGRVQSISVHSIDNMLSEVKKALN
jgi:hypothetical protein